MKQQRGPWTFVGTLVGVAGAYWLAKTYRVARATSRPFDRQVYPESRALVRAFRDLWDNPDDLRSLYANLDLAPMLAEKIMLAVAGACGHGHTSRLHYLRAARRGLSAAAIHSLLRGEVDHATPQEAPAVFFATHYAHMGGHPDADLVRNLVSFYGARTAHDLITYIRLAMFANQAGNTLDGLLSRLLGRPAPGMTLREELLSLLILVFGVMPLLPLLILRAALSHEERPLALQQRCAVPSGIEEKTQEREEMS